MRSSRPGRRAVLLLALLAALAPRTAPAQTTPAQAAGWNAPRALELIERARDRRSAATTDTGLVNYQSDARLYVYFYLDRPDTGERNLVKTDQLALEVLWQAPNQVKQRIVGWRDEKSLPTNINYHLDHLTVVLENFGDEIRLGDGDEVRGVPHPAAAGSEMVYDYRLADSLTLRLPGVPEPLRVYELHVRPKDPDRPAFLGSVFVDRRAGDLVRMDFTFTRSSYIDRYLDYINISLDNGLWRGRFWLPNEQRVEIRRRVPVLDIPAGSVIRATMRVGNYRFNEPLPPRAFAGPRVVAVPREEREAFPFEQGLHEEVREEGIGPEVELGEIRRQAAELVQRRALERFGGTRLSIGGVSEALRYNRAEGLFLGAGARLASGPPVAVEARAGWALGAGHAVLSLDGSAGPLRGSLYLNRPRDVGVGPVVSGAVNTASALLAGADYLDLYYASGAELSAETRLVPGWALRAGVRAERQTSAETSVGFSVPGNDFRAVRAIDDADLALGASLVARREGVAEAARSWSAELGLETGLVNPVQTDVCVILDSGECRNDFQGGFLKPRAAVDWARRWAPRDAELRLSGRAGAAFGDLPAQEVYRIGGRGTVPGYRFREFGGARFATAGATLSADLSPPWLRGRVSGALGWAGQGGASLSERARDSLLPTGQLKPSLGVGVAIFHDILRVDLARGLGAGGRWELIVDANPSFWDFL